MLQQSVRLSRIVVFELIEERMGFVHRNPLNFVRHRDRRRRRLLQLDLNVRLQQIHQLRTEIDLRRMGDSIRHQELIHNLHQRLLADLIEALEDLETVELQFVANKIGLILVLGHCLGIVVHDTLLNRLKFFQKSLRVVADGSRSGRTARIRHARLHPMRDQFSDVVLNEGLLCGVKITIDVAKGGEIENDGVHLFFGNLGIGTKIQHRENMQKESARAKSNSLFWAKPSKNRRRSPRR